MFLLPFLPTAAKSHASPVTFLHLAVQVCHPRTFPFSVPSHWRSLRQRICGQLIWATHQYRYPEAGGGRCGWHVSFWTPQWAQNRRKTYIAFGRMWQNEEKRPWRFSGSPLQLNLSGCSRAHLNVQLRSLLCWKNVNLSRLRLKHSIES